MFTVLTTWHDENPNCWVALEMTDKPKKGHGRNPNKFILQGRAKSLVSLNMELGEGHEYIFSTAWTSGIGKDWKIGESRDEYYARHEKNSPEGL